MSNDTLIISGCDLLKIVHKAGLCRTNKDNEKAADITKILAESQSAYEKANATPPKVDPVTGKTEPAEKESFLKHLYTDLAMQSNRIISSTKYDFCKPNVTPPPASSQECGAEAGYEIRTSWRGLLTKDVVPLCEGISSILSTAVKPAHLPSCLRMAFYDQKQKIEEIGEPLSATNDASFTIAAAQCLNTVELSEPDDEGMSFNLAAYNITDPVSEKPIKQIVDLEWLCGKAMSSILTQADLADMSAGKKPEGVQALEKCFESELGGVKWNTLVEADKRCMEAEDSEPWAYGFAAVGGTVLVTGAVAATGLALRMLAYIAGYALASSGAHWLAGKKAFFDRVEKRKAGKGGDGDGKGAAKPADQPAISPSGPAGAPPTDKQTFERLEKKCRSAESTPVWVYPAAAAAAGAAVALAKTASKNLPGWHKAAGALFMAGGAIIVGKEVNKDDLISDILCGVIGCGEAN